MKKLALVLGLVLVISLVLVGCKSVTTPGTPIIPTPATGNSFETQKFHVKWYFKIDPFKNLYVPIPIPDNFQPSVENVKLSPEPDEIYEDPDYGNKIAHYKNYDNSIDFSMEFDITLQKGRQYVDPNNIGTYDTNSEIYNTYMGPNNMIQTDSPILIQAAKEIVGNETNPYKKAKLIQEYIVKNIGLPETQSWHDALNTYLNGASYCGGRANLFVALCRIEGIPARIVSGLHMFKEGTWIFDSSNGIEEYGIHIWAEIYLPNYGWIFVDPGNPDGFANIYEYRIKLSRGADIRLDPEKSFRASHFHIPIGLYFSDGEYHDYQTENHPLYLSISKIQ